MRAPLCLLQLLLAVQPALAQDIPKFKHQRAGAGPGAVKTAADVRTQAAAAAADCQLSKEEVEAFSGTYDAEGTKLAGAIRATYGLLRTRSVEPAGFNAKTLEQVRAYVEKGEAAYPGYGAPAAKLGLRVAVMGWWSRVSEDGMDYLGKLSGVPPNHSVVREKMPRGKVYDCNFNDSLEAGSDGIFLAPESGKLGMKPMGALPKHWFDEIMSEKRIQEAVVKAAKDMAGKMHGFAGPKDTKYAAGYWNPGKEQGHLMFRHSPTPWESMKNLLDKPASYAFECKTAIKLTYALAIMRLMGEESDHADFDRVFQDGSVSPGNDHGVPLSSVLKEFGRPPAVPWVNDDQEEAFIASLHPGDWVYVYTEGACEQLKNEHWSGENMIYLGNKEFFAHGPTKRITSLKEVKDDIKGRAAQIEKQDPDSGCGMVNPRLINQYRRLMPKDVFALWRRGLDARF